MGSDCTELVRFQWWTDLFESYISTYRPILLKKASRGHNYVFVTRSGEPFSGPYFSEFISSLIYKHTGKRVATNGLRSSFITSFYGSDAAKDPEMRESLAKVMRHSTKEAQRTYDRRTATERKRKALDMLAMIAEERQKRQSSGKGTACSPSSASVHGDTYKTNNHDNHNEDGATISPNKPAEFSLEALDAVVVEIRRHPHLVIRRHPIGDEYLVARMTRSKLTTEPCYYVPPDVRHEWVPMEDCKEMLGLWKDDEFELI